MAKNNRGTLQFSNRADLSSFVSANVSIAFDEDRLTATLRYLPVTWPTLLQVLVNEGRLSAMPVLVPETPVRLTAENAKEITDLLDDLVQICDEEITYFNDGGDDDIADDWRQNKRKIKAAKKLLRTTK